MLTTELNAIRCGIEKISSLMGLITHIWRTYKYLSFHTF